MEALNFSNKKIFSFFFFFNLELLLLLLSTTAVKLPLFQQKNGSSDG